MSQNGKCLLLVVLPLLGASAQTSRCDPPTAMNYGQKSTASRPLPPLTATRLDIPTGSIAFAADMKSIIGLIHYEHKLVSWNLATGKIQWETQLHPCDFRGLACSPDGKFIALAEAIGGKRPNEERDIYLIDQGTGRKVKHWSANDRCFTMVAFSPNGKWLATGGLGTGAKVWDVETSRLLFSSDTPKTNQTEFRSVSRVFAMLERIDSPEVRAYLETLAKRPAGDWFAITAAESFKRMTK